MQSIKAIVVALGIVLLLGTGALVGVMVERLAGAARSGAGSGTPESSRTLPAPPLAGGFGRLSLDRAGGSQLRAVTAVGHLLVLHLGADSPGGDELVVIDPARGAVLGTIRLKDAP